MRKFFLAFFLFLVFSSDIISAKTEIKVYPPAPMGEARQSPLLWRPAPAEKKYSVGEKFVYQINYLGIPVGESVSEIKEIVMRQDRQAYHIEVKVHSYRAIDLVYKVRDEHQSYVDVETLASLEYERKIQEGRRRVYEHMELDQVNHIVRYKDEQGKVQVEQPLVENAQDPLSCGYFARTFEFSEKSALFIPVHADKKNWNLEVKFYEISPLTLDSIGKFQVMHLEPLMEFQGIFFRKGKVEGWVSLDKRRIPVKMKVKIPVLGNISAELTEYQPGQG